MKVRELIELLSQCDPELTVVAPLETSDWVERPRLLYTVRVVRVETSNGFERDYPTGPVVILDDRYTEEAAVVPREPRTVVVPPHLIDFRFFDVPTAEKLTRRFGWNVETPIKETLVWRLGWALYLHSHTARHARLWLAEIWAEIVGEAETNPILLLNYIQEATGWIRVAKVVLENNPELIPWAEATLSGPPNEG